MRRASTCSATSSARTRASYAASEWSLKVWVPSRVRICHAVTVSFIRPSRARKPSSARWAAPSPQRAASAAIRSRPRALPSAVRRNDPADSSTRPSATSRSEDRADLLGRGEQRRGGHLRGRIALHHQRPHELVCADARRCARRPRSRPPSRSGHALPPTGIASSAAHASERRRLGHDHARTGNGAGEHLAAATVDRDRVTGQERPAAHRDDPVADLDRGGADDRRDPPATRHHRGVAGEAAARGEDARPTGPCRARRPARSPPGPGRPPARRRPRPRPLRVTWRSRRMPPRVSAGRPVTRTGRPGIALGRDLRRVRQDVDHPPDGFLAGQREVRGLGHVECDPERGLRAALPDPALEHPQLAVLDRELDVAQVPVVALQAIRVVRAARGRCPASARRGRRSAPSDGSRPRRPRPAR